MVLLLLISVYSTYNYKISCYLMKLYCVCVFRALDDTSIAAQQPVEQLSRMQQLLDALQAQVRQPASQPLSLHLVIYIHSLLMFAFTLHSVMIRFSC